MYSLNRFTFCLVGFCLFIVFGCKPTNHVSYSKVIKAAKEVTVSDDFKGFTYLKNGEKITTRRDLQGKISTTVTDSIFSLALGKTHPERPDVLLIHYYPARTPYNSTGSCYGECIKKKYKYIERQISKKKRTAAGYLVRPQADMGKYVDIAPWKNDINLLMERYFVPHPQLGNSFIVLCKNGDYEAYLGEFSQSYLLEVFDRVYKEYDATEG